MALIGYGVFFLTKSISFLWNCFCKKWNDDISKIKASKAIKKKDNKEQKNGLKKKVRNSWVTIEHHRETEILSIYKYFRF